MMKYEKCSRKLLSIMLTLALILGMVNITTVTTVAANKGANSTVKVQVLATSDLHGRFMSYEYAVNEATNKGSLTQLYSAINELRNENPNTILVDNGDTIQDNSGELFLSGKGNPMMIAMNEMGYDAWTLGNHEFNYLPQLDHVLKQSKATILCGNVYRPDGTPLGEDYKIITKDGVKIAVIGMVTPNITRWDGPNLKGWKVTDPVEETKAVVKQLKGKVDAFIAVAHMGLESEYGVEGSGVMELANKVPELAVIVAGHAHSAIDGQLVNGVLITEPSSVGQALSKVDLTFEKSGKSYNLVSKESKLVYMNDSKAGKVYAEDEGLVNKLAPYHKTALDDALKPIGKLVNGDLVPKDKIPGVPTIQIQPTPLISLINKIQMEYGNADISASAAFRTDINVKEGVLSKADAAKIYKYDNTLYVVKITGAQLKNYMEWSAQYYNTYKPGDLTVSFNPDIRGYNYDMFSGVNYEVDISKPVVTTDKVAPGNPHLHFASSRIVNLTKADGTPVLDTDVFRLAVNNYRYSSVLSPMFGDELEVLYRSEDVLGTKGGIRDIIVDYIQKNKVITNFTEANWKITGTSFSANDVKDLLSYMYLGKISIPVSADGRTPNVKAITTEELNKLRDKEANRIKIITFNDLHGNVESTSKEAGIANIASAINTYRSINPNVVAVTAGDNYQGTAISNILYGKPVNSLMLYNNIEYSAIGNHEFDWGRERIEEWAKEGKFAFLCANIYDEATNKPVSWTTPYAIKEVDGTKVAFIGFTTPETAFKTKPSNIAGLKFLDPAEIAPSLIEEVKGKGADVLIALTHLGAMQDGNKVITGEAAELAQKVTGFDLIISAHTHMVVNGKVNGTPIIQTGKNGRNLGVINLNMRGNNLENVDMEILPIGNMNASTKGDPVVTHFVEKYKKEVGTELNVKIGQTDKTYEYDRYSGVSELGEWVSEVMRQAGDAQIGITNGGGIRTPIEKGDITIGTLYNLMPFDNTVVTMKMKGSDIKKLLEHGIYNPEVGCVQYAGIKVHYNAKKAAGDRVSSIEFLDGTKLLMDEYYIVATNDFMAENGDNYDFANAKDMINTNVPIRDVLIDAIKDSGRLNFKGNEILTEGADISSINQVNPLQKTKKAA